MTFPEGSKILVLGGARSGKSAIALAFASALPGRKAYLATAQAHDDEMRARISLHIKERPADWETFEEPIAITDLISEIGCRYDVILIDCLTLWLSNLMLRGQDTEAGFTALIRAVREAPATLFMVSNEVGMGIVPDNRLARAFRDCAGIMNQKAAAAADLVYFVAAGIPLRIKGTVANGKD